MTEGSGDKDLPSGLGYGVLEKKMMKCGFGEREWFSFRVEKF